MKNHTARLAGFVALISILIISGCTASKKGSDCGCPAKKGIVGYNYK